jgi:hypothetical protein
MIPRLSFVVFLVGASLVVSLSAPPAPGCCPAWLKNSGKPVVNADQTVILIWDAAAKVQHFIRRASFKSEAEDFGFIIPSPSQPELSESGNEAFPYLLKVTEPETIKQRAPRGGMGCGCVGAKKSGMDKEEPPGVRVLEEKIVAGFKAAVLEATSAEALVNWLAQNKYSYSPEVAAWAKPYIDRQWKFTALKVAREAAREQRKDVEAPALRMTFKTDRPLFPYREPDYGNDTKSVGASHRLLRIYFLAEARYQGEFEKGEEKWTGKVAWANPLSAADRQKVLELLKLPANTGPAEWFLTEFEDEWPYRVAPADVYFSRSAVQDTLKRPPIIVYVSAPYPTDVTVYALAAAMVVPLLLRRLSRGRKA